MVNRLIDKTDRLLITGATGFIGSYILRYLVDQGYTNIVATHRLESRFDLVADIKDRVKWVVVDLRNVSEVFFVMKGIRYIIHTAAMVSLADSDIKKMFSINVEGTKNIVDAALENNVVKLVHISSIATLGKTKNSNIINEHMEFEDSNYKTPYAQSKYESEMEIRRAEAEGLSVSILNPSVVLGAGYWKNSSVKIFETMYKSPRFYPLGATGFVDVRDVAMLAIKLLDNRFNSIRVIANGENWDFRKLMNEIAINFNISRPIWPILKMAIPFLWRLLSMVSFITRKSFVYTRHSMLNSSIKWTYDNSLSKDVLDHEYIKLEETIKQTCDQFLDSDEKGLDYGILPLL